MLSETSITGEHLFCAPQWERWPTTFSTWIYSKVPWKNKTPSQDRCQVHSSCMEICVHFPNGHSCPYIFEHKFFYCLYFIFSQEHCSVIRMLKVNNFQFDIPFHNHCKILKVTPWQKQVWTAFNIPLNEVIKRAWNCALPCCVGDWNLKICRQTEFVITLHLKPSEFFKMFKPKSMGVSMTVMGF